MTATAEVGSVDAAAPTAKADVHALAPISRDVHYKS